MALGSTLVGVSLFSQQLIWPSKIIFFSVIPVWYSVQGLLKHQGRTWEAQVLENHGTSSVHHRMEAPRLDDRGSLQVRAQAQQHAAHLAWPRLLHLGRG